MLNVNDGDKVLLRRLDVSDDVVKLFLRRHAGAVKMIAANAQSGTSGFSKVSPVGVVHIVGPFRCFEVNVGDVRASNHALPVNGALVMRNVNALFVFRVDISLIAKNPGIILIVKIIPKIHKEITPILYLFIGLIILYKIKNPPVKNK